MTFKIVKFFILPVLLQRVPSFYQACPSKAILVQNMHQLCNESNTYKNISKIQKNVNADEFSH